MNTNDEQFTEEKQDDGKYLTPEICADLVQATKALCEEEFEGLAKLGYLFYNVICETGYEAYINLYYLGFTSTIKAPAVSGYESYDNPKSNEKLSTELQNDLNEILDNINLSDYYVECGRASDTPVISLECVYDLLDKFSLIDEDIVCYLNAEHLSLQNPHSNNFTKPLSQALNGLKDQIHDILRSIRDGLSEIRYNIQNTMYILQSNNNNGNILSSSNVHWDKTDY